MMGIRLLVAERDAPLREVFQWALKGRGYEVETAADEGECLEKLCAMRTDILLLDRELPSAAGMDMVDRLRRCGARQIPIVLLAGGGSPGALAGLVVARVIACVQKPFRFRTSLDVLSSASSTTNTVPPPSRSA